MYRLSPSHFSSHPNDRSSGSSPAAASESESQWTDRPSPLSSPSPAYSASDLYQDRHKSKEQLITELSDLRQQLVELTAIKIRFHALTVEQGRAQKRLQDSQQQFAAMVANVPGVVFRLIFRPDGRVSFSYLGPGIRQLTGFDAQVLRHRPQQLFELVHPDDRPIFQRQLRRSRETLTDFELEYRCITASEQIKWVHCQARLSQQASGAILMDGLLLDASDRNQQEATWRTGEACFRAVAYASPELILLSDAEWSVFYLSSAAEALWGYQPDEALGSCFLQALHPDDRPLLQTVTAQLLAQPGWPIEFSYRLRHRQGHWVAVQGIATNWLHDPDIQAFLLISHGKPLTDTAAAAGTPCDRARDRPESSPAETSPTSLFEVSPVPELSVPKLPVPKLSEALELPDLSGSLERSDSSELLDLPELPKTSASSASSASPELSESSVSERDRLSESAGGNPHPALFHDSSEDLTMADLASSQVLSPDRLVQQVLQPMRRLVRTMQQSLDIHAIFALAVTELVEHCQIDRAMVIQWQSDPQAWQVLADQHLPGLADLIAAELPEALFPMERLYRQAWVTIDQAQLAENPATHPYAEQFLGQWQVLPLRVTAQLWGALVVGGRSFHPSPSPHTSSPHSPSPYPTPSAQVPWEPADWLQSTWMQATWIQTIAEQLSIAVQRQQLFHQLQIAQTDIEQLSPLDPLTHLPNREHLEQYLQQEWQRLTREQLALSVILCEVDHFHLYNALCGETAGGHCLRQIAQTIRKAVKRPADFVACYNAETFAVILPHTELEGAIQVAQTIQTAIQTLDLSTASLPPSAKPITLSLGIAEALPDGEHRPQVLIDRASQALYRSIQRGRNCLSVHPFTK